LLNKNIVQIDWRVVKPISGYGGKAGEFFHFAMEENRDEHPHFLHSGIGLENNYNSPNWMIHLLRKKRMLEPNETIRTAFQKVDSTDLKNGDIIFYRSGYS